MSNNRATNLENTENTVNSAEQPLVDQPSVEQVVTTEQVLTTPTDLGYMAMVEAYETGKRYLKQAEVFIEAVNLILKDNHLNDLGLTEETRDVLTHLANFARDIIDSNPFKNDMIITDNLKGEAKNKSELEFFSRLTGEKGDYQEFTDYLKKLGLFSAIYAQTTPFVSNAKFKPFVENFNNAHPNLEDQITHKDHLNDNNYIHAQRMQKYPLFSKTIIKETNELIAVLEKKHNKTNADQEIIDQLNKRVKSAEKLQEKVLTTLDAINKSMYILNLQQAKAILAVSNAIEANKSNLTRDQLSIMRDKILLARTKLTDVNVKDILAKEESALFPREKKLLALAKKTKVNVTVNGNEEEMPFLSALQKGLVNTKVQNEFLANKKVDAALNKVKKERFFMTAELLYNIIRDPKISISLPNKQTIYAHLGELSSKFIKTKAKEILAEAKQEKAKLQTALKQVENLPEQRLEKQIPLESLNEFLRADKRIVASYKGIDEALKHLKYFETLENGGEKLSRIEKWFKNHYQNKKDKYESKVLYINNLNAIATDLSKKEGMEFPPRQADPILEEYENKWFKPHANGTENLTAEDLYKSRGLSRVYPEESFKGELDSIKQYCESIRGIEDNIQRLKSIRRQLNSKPEHSKKYRSRVKMKKHIDKEIEKLTKIKISTYNALSDKDAAFSDIFQHKLISEERKKIRDIEEKGEGALNLDKLTNAKHFQGNSNEFKKFAESVNVKLKQRSEIGILENNSTLLRDMQQYNALSHSQDLSRVTLNSYKEFGAEVAKKIDKLNVDIASVPKEMEKQRKDLLSSLAETKMKQMDPSLQLEYIRSAAQVLIMMAETHETLMQDKKPATSDISDKFSKEMPIAKHLVELLTDIEKSISEKNQSNNAHKRKEITPFRASLVRFMQNPNFEKLPKHMKNKIKEMNRGLLVAHEKKLSIGERIGSYLTGNKYLARNLKEKDKEQLEVNNSDFTEKNEKPKSKGFRI